jgi:hypothetical protein
MRRDLRDSGAVQTRRYILRAAEAIYERLDILLRQTSHL